MPSMAIGADHTFTTCCSPILRAVGVFSDNPINPLLRSPAADLQLAEAIFIVAGTFLSSSCFARLPLLQVIIATMRHPPSYFSVAALGVIHLPRYILQLDLNVLVHSRDAVPRHHTMCSRAHCAVLLCWILCCPFFRSGSIAWGREKLLVTQIELKFTGVARSSVR